MNLSVGRLYIKLPKPLRIFWLVNIALTGLCVAIMHRERQLHRQEPYTSPFIPFHHFIDLVCFISRFQHVHRLDFFSEATSFGQRFMYPAPVALLYESFYASGWHLVRLFFLGTMIPVLALGVILGREMVRRGIGPGTTLLFLSSAAFFSYPFWFEYLLGNMEICIFLIVAFGIVAFLRQHFVLAATLIGVAASMKIFPFVYFALFLSRRKYKELALGVFAAAVTTLASLWLVCPSLPIAYRGVRSGLAAFQRLYILQFLPVETGFDHSIFGFIKLIFFHFYRATTIPSHLLTGYLAFASVTGLALYFFRIRFLPLLNQVLCLSIASILLPPTSHDYTLLHLYVPWGLMVLFAIDQARANRSMDRLMSVFICFAILMSAESELIYEMKGHSGQLKAIVLVVLLYIGLKYPFGPVETQIRVPADA